MKHVFTEHWGLCSFEQNHQYCPVCANKFQFCERCCLYTGCLTTECPGYNAYPVMGIYVYYGVADYVNWQWVFPGTDIRVYELYKEALRYYAYSPYDVQDMSAPSLRKLDFSRLNQQAQEMQVYLPPSGEQPF